MPAHPLIIYQLLSKRTRGKLLWLGIVMLLLGLYDLFVEPFLGSLWFLWWGGLLLVALLWLYYALLMRRAKLVVKPAHLLLQGPIIRVAISYGRLQTSMTTQFGRHVAPGLRGSDVKLIKPLLGQTCVLLALHSFPPRLRRRHLWFSRFLFSETQQGLLLAVPDWMQLNRDVDAALQEWRRRHGRRGREDKRTFVAQVLDWE